MPLPIVETLLRGTVVEVKPDLQLWCEQILRSKFGSQSQVRSLTPIPSRIASVYRVATTDNNGREQVFFLKELAEDSPRSTLEERFRQLYLLSEALQKEPAATPYVVVAYDAERRLLLTQEMSGRQILALHTGLLRRDRSVAAEKAWYLVGRWLAALHWGTLPPITSNARAGEIENYTRVRLLAWANADPRQESAIRAADDALSVVSRRCAAQPLVLTPCHGDVSGFNILVSRTVGLVDFDDFRFDLPSLDLSEAVLEIRNLSRAWRVIPLPHFAARAERALQDGYGERYPRGDEFWIQHFRNLAVYGLTLARRRAGLSLSRITDELHYRRIVRELRKTTRLSLDGDDYA